MLFVLHFFIAAVITASNAVADEWTYENQGYWSPKICMEGPHQSPIALSTSLAEQVHLTPFSLYGYGRSMTTILQNNGHSVKIIPKSNKILPEINGGGLTEVYMFDHLHFHWKSEHTMEGERYPLEMHMVHYAKKYGSFEEASKHTNKGSVAVFAILFHLSPDDFQEFHPVLNAVIDIRNQVYQEKELDGFVIKHFMPMDLAGFYRYNGSLTTPGCNEEIIWTLFVHTLPVSQAQVDIFRAIRTFSNTSLRENFRELQPLHDRKILIKMSPMTVSGSNILFISYGSVFIVFLNCLYKYISTN